MEYSWVTSRNGTRTLAERSPNLSGSASNISQTSQESANSAKRIKSSLDVVQLIKTNYGISLSKECESRLLEACPLSEGDVNDELLSLQDTNAVKRSECHAQLEADTVDQLYQLTKFRQELSLDVEPVAQWTDEQFQQASELMKLISKKSSQVRRTLNAVAELAEDLKLVDPNHINV